jgi:hypothetical protein
MHCLFRLHKENFEEFRERVYRRQIPSPTPPTTNSVSDYKDAVEKEEKREEENE